MKKLKLLIVANDCNWPSLPSKLKELCQWFSSTVEFSSEIKHTFFKNVPFDSYDNSDPLVTAKYLFGINRQWYDENVTILANGFDIVLFLMNTQEWKGQDARGWRTDRDQGPVELQIAADEEEMRRHSNGGVVSAFFDYARHELLHALFLIAGQKDTTHYWWDRNDLGAARNELIFTDPRNVDEHISWLSEYIQRLIAFLGLLLLAKKKEEITPEPPQSPEPPKESLLVKWALAIQQIEGYVPGSKSFRNKNPGNLRYVGQKLAIGKDLQNFAIFKTYEDGFETLKQMLYNAGVGKSKVYSPEMTLLQFFQIYAPTFDNNQPDIYARFIANQLKVEVNVKIKYLI